MKVKLSGQGIDRIECEAVISYFFADERPLQGTAGWIDWRLDGCLSRLINSGKINGNFKEFILIGSQDMLCSPRIILVGLGNSAQFSLKRFTQISGEIRNVVQRMKLFHLATSLPGLHLIELDPSRAAEIFLVKMAKGSGVKRAKDFDLTLTEDPTKFDRIVSGSLQAKQKLKGKPELEVWKEEVVRVD